jgi:hypothetical protein
VSVGWVKMENKDQILRHSNVQRLREDKKNWKSSVRRATRAPKGRMNKCHSERISSEGAQSTRSSVCCRLSKVRPEN